MPTSSFVTAGASQLTVMYVLLACVCEQATLDNVTFLGNESPYGDGGGLRVSDNATLEGTNIFFINNSARVSGGGLLVDRDGHVSITGCIFKGNTASIGAAVSASERAVVQLDSCTFENNSAASAGQDIKADAGVKLSLQRSNIEAREGKTVLWLRRECDLGEVLDMGYCQSCPPLTYGLDPTFTTCTTCPANANCTGGGAIIPLTGYWQSHNYSSQMHKCPREESCGYGGMCAEGYTGNVCGECSSPAYGSLGPFRCGKCMSKGKLIGLYLAASLVIMVFVSLLVHTTINDNVNGVDGERPSDFAKIIVRHLQYLAIVSTLGARWPKSLSIIFTAIGWLFASGTSEVVSLDCLFALSSNPVFPTVMKGTLVYLLAPLAMLFVVLLVRAVLRLLWKVLAPCLPCEGAAKVSTKRPAYTSVISVASLVVLFFFYPSLVRLSLSMFACIPLDNSGNTPYPEYALANATRGYLVSDIMQACWEGWHKVWALALGIPCVLLYCLGVPLCIAVLLVTNKDKLQQGTHCTACLGFLYHNYRNERFYWEVVRTVQIIVLVAISVFRYTLGSYLCMLLLQAAFGIILGMEYLFQPYS